MRVSEHVSAIIQKKMPPKCAEPGIFTIPCTLRDTTFSKAMLDLGASINVVPYSLFEPLKLGPLHKNDVVVHLADRSQVVPRGVVRDVLVRVGKLTFPADFYVLDMDYDVSVAPILLGRPFLKTAKTKIDVDSGSLTMEFDGEVVDFNIYDTKESLTTTSICAISVVNEKVQDSPQDIGETFEPLGMSVNVPEPSTRKPRVKSKKSPYSNLSHAMRGGMKGFVWRVKKPNSLFGYNDLKLDYG